MWMKTKFRFACMAQFLTQNKAKLRGQSYRIWGSRYVEINP